MSREYRVGHKKPPVEHQFKAGNSGGRKRANRKRRLPEFANQLNQPLRARRGGRSVAVDPFEAGMNSLVREALKGKPRALKEVLKIFEKAGLLNARRPANPWLLGYSEGPHLSGLSGLAKQVGISALERRDARRRQSRVRTRQA